MKCTKSESILFKEISQKYNLKNEGFLMNFFKKRLKNKLDNDIQLQKALIDADKELDSLRDYVKQAEKEGRHVPAYVKRYL
jgi:glutaredoxin